VEALDIVNRRAIGDYLVSFETNFMDLYNVMRFLHNDFEPTFKDKHDDMMKYLKTQADEAQKLLRGTWNTY